LHRKLTADQIFNGYEMLPQDSVLIIDKEGVIIDISTLENSGEEIEKYTGIITPGFINCHCHLELSHLKDKIPSKTGLIDFLKNIINHRNEENELIINSIDANEKKMIANGIVAVGDICNTKHTIQQKRVNNLYYHNFIEVAGFPTEIAEARFDSIQQIHTAFVNNGLIASIVPHAPYSVSTSLLEKIVYFIGNEVMTMHNQETLAENEWYEKGTGLFQQFYDDLSISTSSFLPKKRAVYNISYLILNRTNL
jgi:cytosine/adenosine deaminase-related metal-dependent hydrolase